MQEMFKHRDIKLKIGFFFGRFQPDNTFHRKKKDNLF